jgi:hypothetical protein
MEECKELKLFLVQLGWQMVFHFLLVLHMVHQVKELQLVLVFNHLDQKRDEDLLL